MSDEPVAALDPLDLPYAHGTPPLTGVAKARPEDFVVEELLGFEPSGEGEHAFLAVEKRGANTDWVAKRLAAHARVAPLAVGYAGLKDRHAVTRQHFTVQLPRGADCDFTAIDDPEFRVLAATRHARKLKRGALTGNRFVLVLREVAGDRDAAEARLAAIERRGVPNCFGAQRFGRGGANVAGALALFAGARVGRAERSMRISAARSALFNAVLASRVEDGSWERAREGDVFQLDGRGSIFGPEPIDAVIAARVDALAIHPTGPLWGRGALRTTGEVEVLERAIADRNAALAAGLEAAGLEQERRSLRLPVRAIERRWDGDVLELRFALPAGAYATAVLRELVSAPASEAHASS